VAAGRSSCRPPLLPLSRLPKGDSERILFIGVSPALTQGPSDSVSHGAWRGGGRCDHDPGDVDRCGSLKPSAQFRGKIWRAVVEQVCAANYFIDAHMAASSVTPGKLVAGDPIRSTSTKSQNLSSDMARLDSSRLVVASPSAGTRKRQLVPEGVSSSTPSQNQGFKVRYWPMTAGCQDIWARRPVIRACRAIVPQVLS